jgi:hypothetical protein
MRAAKSFWNALRQRHTVAGALVTIVPSTPFTVSAALAHKPRLSDILP